MRTWISSKVLRLALVLAMTLSVLLPPVGPSTSHDPALILAEIERHAALAAEHDDHGHRHDGWFGGPHAGHPQGHNPADHDHVTQAPAESQSFSFLRTCESWDAVPPRSCDHGPCFCIDRPPRV